MPYDDVGPTAQPSVCASVVVENKTSFHGGFRECPTDGPMISPSPAGRRPSLLPAIVVSALALLLLLAMYVQSVAPNGNRGLVLRQNGSCTERPLEGTYFGEGDIMGSFFRWRTTQTFYANGTHDIDQVVLADPLGVVPEMHCRSVPFVTDEPNCSVRIIRDACMLAAIGGLEIVEEGGVWAPERDELRFILVVQATRVSFTKVDLSYSLKKEEAEGSEATAHDSNDSYSSA